MAKAKSETTTAITKTETAPALALVDPLAGVLGGEDLGVTGAEEMGREDVRIPAFAWNTKFVDKATGEPIPPTRFLNTITEEVKPKLRLQVITNHKSRAWSEFDEAEGKRLTHCRSWDCVTGTMAEGGERACAQCPDYQWRKDPETGKNTRRCSDVYNLVVLDRETGDIAMLRLRKTAIAPFRDFYQKHFYRKRPVAGRVGAKVDLPLFAVETHVSLKMERSGSMSWATPVFERGDVLGRDEILAGAQAVRDFREVHLAALERAAEQAEHIDGGGESGDTSFDFGANDGGSSPAAAGAGRF